MYKVLAAIFVLYASAAWASPSPCDGINRDISNERKAQLAPSIANQLHVSNIDILQSFQTDDWSILYVGTQHSDEVFLFYAHDPVASSYVTQWSGAAMHEEEQKIKDWTLENAPGIPEKLASCFAWHVTNNRDK